jgi:hypothetical protein
LNFSDNEEIKYIYTKDSLLKIENKSDEQLESIFYQDVPFGSDIGATNFQLDRIMKFYKIICYLPLVFIAFGCEEDRRLPIKIIETKKGYYKWYYYSLITSSGPDHIDYVDENCERTLVYKGHDVVDVRLENAKLVVECDQCDFIEFNQAYKKRVRIIESDNNTYLERVHARQYKDSLKRNTKIKECNR